MGAWGLGVVWSEGGLYSIQGFVYKNSAPSVSLSVDTLRVTK